jgi:hypothetical protein
MKYKIKQNISNWFDEGLQANPYYCAGDIIEFNQWINAFGKPFDCYKYRMFTPELIIEYKDFLEEIK